MKPLQMWGGVECALNRVGDSYFDQCGKSGHNDRHSDLALFSSLGIKKLRQPCLWELVAPKDLDHCNWSFLDERLNELRRLNLTFIAGLLHHGSGPLYTSLIDPDFPEKFATYARLFATRYPWVEDYTPINEINATAKSSCLFGHWFPHLKDDTYYLKALINQCKATVLALREIRRINPKARLIQTENMDVSGSIEFDDQRRWLSLDLLMGKIGELHPLYEYIKRSKISDDELRWFEEFHCSPEVIGINHQVQANGLEEIIMETWERYGKAIAINCHARGTREEQMRRLDQAWKTAQDLKSQGVDIEAVTAWGLLGTHNERAYEPGLAKLIKDLPTRGRSASPIVHNASPLLITGAGGALGQAFAKACETRNINYRLLSNEEMDISGLESIILAVERHRPWAIINAADHIKVDAAESERAKCFRENVHGPVNLARTCLHRGIRLVNFSSDLVFDGNYGQAYVESHPVSPRNVYGESKAECEERVLAIYPQSLMVRSSAFFDPWGEHNFITKTLMALTRNDEVTAPNDMFISPTYVPDLANECLNLLIDEVTGIVHLTNVGEVSWAEFASMAAEMAKDTFQVDPKLIRVVNSGTRNSTLRSERHSGLPRLEDAIRRYLMELQIPLGHQKEIHQ